MTYDGKNECADNPRACRGIIRAIRYTLPIVMCLSLAFAPFSAKLTNSGLCVEKSEARAEVTATPYAYDFLVTMAAAMDMTVNEAIATVTGITAGASGMVIANDDGVSFHGDQNNLDNLAEAADYPSWDTLDQTQQQAWGTKDNYDSAKFNSLMDAFGLGDARDRFYANSGSFDFNDTENQRIDRLGRIGNLWMNKIGVSAGELKETILDLQSISKYFPSQATSDKVFDGSNVAGWPVELPTQVGYAYPTTECGMKYNGGTWYGLYDCSVACYSVLWVYNNSTVRWDMFATDPFTVQYGIKRSRYLATSYQGTYDNKPVYYFTASTSLSRLEGSDTNPVNNVSSAAITIDDTKRINYMGAILYGESGGSSGGGETTVPEYPEEIPDDEDVYFPPEGITPEVSWPVYIEIQRPDNIYNPDDKTQTPEWKQETKQNVLPLQNIKFDKLFPFCLLTDVKELSEKIDNTITPGQQSDYKKLNIPMAYASDGQGGFQQEDIELDGQPLYDLLVMAKPFNQIMLLFFLVFSLVMFWKSILTGD